MAEVQGRIVSVTLAFGTAALGVPLPKTLSYVGASLVRRLPPKWGWNPDPVVFNGARIDLVRDTGLPPAQAIAVDPEDEEEDVPVDGSLAWQDGGYADIYDVYLGTDPDSLVLVSADQDATNYTWPSDLAYETVYYWRVDSKNVNGTTTGVVWSFTTELAPPDLAPLVGRWTWPITERLRFLTQILAGHDRTEQRIAHRCTAAGLAVPGQSFSTRLAVFGDEAVARMEAILDGWLKQTWPIPVWPMAQRHTAALPADSSAIAIDTRWCDYRADGLAMIWQSEDAYEVVVVDSVAESALTLKDGTLAAYSGPKWILPCRIGWVTSIANVERYGGGLIVNLTWETDGADLAAVSGYVAAMEYDGMTVLTDPALGFQGSFNSSHDADFAVLGGDTGPFEIVSNSTVNETAQDHGWVCRTLEAAWKLRQFLHAMRGRQSAFLVPTFRRDLVLTRPAAPSDTVLYVANRGLTANRSADSQRTYLAFRPAGSSIVVRPVTGIAELSAAEETITLYSSAGVAAAAGAILCWVDKCRLASDEVVFEWLGRGRMTCSAQFVRVS